MNNGILKINKPEGITSAQTVNKIKKNLNVSKAGHTGTLDPFATGLLIICLNKATKIVPYLSSLDKSYIGTMILGMSTDSQDLTGNIVKINPVKESTLKIASVKKAFSHFQGKIFQTPPMFSALKYHGKPLYLLARKGITLELKSREVYIQYIKLLNVNMDPYPSITFHVKCSKGTYIRTLCHDIGQYLGYGAYLARLKRISIGDHSLEQAIDLNAFLNKACHEQQKHLYMIDQGLNHLNKVILKHDKKMVKRVLNGVSFTLNKLSNNPLIKVKNNRFFRVYSYQGQFLAIAEVIKKEQGKIIFKIKKVFQKNDY